MQIDLRNGVVPISRAASSLAALLKRAAAGGKPIIVTQKGYPTGVLLSIDAYSALIAGAERSGALAEGVADVGLAGEPEPVTQPEPEPTPAPVKRRPRKAP
jgi:prevent-host-death family protein